MEKAQEKQAPAASGAEQDTLYMGDTWLRPHPSFRGRAAPSRRPPERRGQNGPGPLRPSRCAPLRLAFPATLASRWMPGLFPEKR
jgi:hypothetical protein